MFVCFILGCFIYVLIINLVLHIPRITKGLIYTTSDLINAIVYDCRCKINMFQLISLTPSYIVKNTRVLHQHKYSISAENCVFTMEIFSLIVVYY